MDCMPDPNQAITCELSICNAPCVNSATIITFKKHVSVELGPENVN